MTSTRKRDQADRRTLHHDALGIVDDIAAATSLEALHQLLAPTFRSSGFDHFMISGIPETSEHVRDAVVLTNWPTDWLDMYAREHFIRVDPTVSMCRTTKTPFVWSDAPIDPRNKLSRDFMELARDFGLAQGFILPVHEPNGRLGCVSLGGRAPDLDDAMKPTIHFLAMSAFYHARNLMPATKDCLVVNPLTAREQEVLTWAAAGKFHNEIAEIIGITERTVTAHIINATNKLGAANKTQAVVKAMQARFIRI